MQHRLRVWLARVSVLLLCFPASRQLASAQLNLSLSWTYTSTNETGFGVQRAISSNGPWTRIGTVAAPKTSYLDTGLHYATTYYYRVWAYNASVNSPYSEMASYTTPPVPDTTRPTLSIQSPTANEKWTNFMFTVSGKAGDNVAVSNVLVSLNGSGWTSASTGNEWTNWTANVTLILGTNTIAAYAVDTSGNLSTTNKVSFLYVLTAPLTVLINGNGTVSPDYNGVMLDVGVNYEMNARAGSGFVFTNWTGSLTTNGATLKFTMASNLTLTANFVAKPALIPQAQLPKSPLIVEILPPAISDLRVNQGMATLSFESITGLLYTLESKDSLTDGTWTALPVSIIGTGGSASLTDSIAPPACRFYRIRAQAAP